MSSRDLTCNQQSHTGRVAPPPLPFLRWAGGKRWLYESCKQLFQIGDKRLIEPFFGGGAVFFATTPKKALLADLNAELICTYVTVRENWSEVVKNLRHHHRNHSIDYYYRIRNYKPRSPSKKAARFIYLNRTCWNGLYRVNKKGIFNVPKGTKTSVLLDDDDFEAIALSLRSAEIKHQDFALTLASAGVGDFVFVDPPYTIQHNHNGFIKYNESIFSWDDQIRLRDEVVAAAGRGASLVVTNAAHYSVRQLYNGIGRHLVVDRASLISGSAKGRGRFSELVIAINLIPDEEEPSWL